MKKSIVFALTAILALLFAFTGCADTSPRYRIAVGWSEGVEGVIFTQGGERLFPRNGVISTDDGGDIAVEVYLSRGYRQNEPILKVDGIEASSLTLPAAASSAEITAVPNSDVSLTLGEGVGYTLSELKRVDEAIGYTSVVGLKLEEGYRQSSARASVIAVGADYEAITSLSRYDLDEVELKSEGYHSFYLVRVLENTTICVSGVAADGADPDYLATVTHVGGEGYTLRALIDGNNDGISDAQTVLLGSQTYAKGTLLNLMIYRDSAYSAANAKLFAGGTEITGTQGDGADESDPLSNGLIYTIRVEGDITLTVTGVKKIGQFTLHIMNKDGTQRYRNFFRADSLAEALAQVPGNDERENEAYSVWWEPNPGEGYTFRYWRFVGGAFEEITADYLPEEYEDIYCGYVPNGSTPDDPMDRPTVPHIPDEPTVPSADDMPESLVNALEGVAALTLSEKESKQWVLAWAAYQLRKAGVKDVARPAPFGYDNVRDSYLDGIVDDMAGVATNDLWVYAYDMLGGSSDIDVGASLYSAFVNPRTGAHGAANREAFFLEIAPLLGDYETKTSFTVQDNDMDLNISFVLVLDRLGAKWTIGYGNSVKGFTESSFREYAREHAHEQVMSNVIKEVFDYIDTLGSRADSAV